MRRVVFTSVLVLSFFNRTAAQSTSVAGVFPTLDHSGKLSDKFEYSLYYFGALPLVSIKNPDMNFDANVLLLYSEQALTWNLNKRLSLTGSYVYQRERIADNFYANENRTHIQATYKHNLNSFNLKHRLRFDNRFIRIQSMDNTSYTHRLRYLIGVDAPISSKKSDLYFSLYEEAFFNTFKNANAVYAENWAYAALGRKFNEKNKIEAGLLYITWNTGLKNWFHQYYLQLTWISRLDFSRKV